MSGSVSGLQKSCARTEIISSLAQDFDFHKGTLKSALFSRVTQTKGLPILTLFNFQLPNWHHL